jgi:hypothetical protein
MNKKRSPGFEVTAEEEIANLRRQLENNAKVNAISVHDATYTRAVLSAVFDVCGAAEKLLGARMPRGASYLLAALQTIESEVNETRMAIIGQAMSSQAGGDPK